MRRMTNDKVIKLAKEMLGVQEAISDIKDQDLSLPANKAILNNLERRWDEIENTLPESVEVWTGMGRLQIIYDGEIILEEDY